MTQPVYKEYLSEPWFSLILLGLKTSEGRLYKHRFQAYHVGDIIMWYNDDFGKTRFVMTEINNTTIFETFEDFLKNNSYQGLKNALPSMPSLSYGLQVYQKYFSKEDEKKYGVISFGLKVLKYKVIIEQKGMLKHELLGYFSSVEECNDACYEKFYDLIDKDKWNASYDTLKFLWDKNILRCEEKPDFNCKIVDLTDAESIDYYNQYNFAEDL